MMTVDEKLTKSNETRSATAPNWEARTSSWSHKQHVSASAARTWIEVNDSARNSFVPLAKGMRAFRPLLEVLTTATMLRRLASALEIEECHTDSLRWGMAENCPLLPVPLSLTPCPTVPSTIPSETSPSFLTSPSHASDFCRYLPLGTSPSHASDFCPDMIPY